MASAYQTAQMRALPGHAIKRDNDDDMTRTRKAVTGETVAARATVDVSHIGPKYKLKGGLADPWVTTNSDMHRPQPQVSVLQQPENKKAPLNDSIYFLDEKVYKGAAYPKEPERLATRSMKSSTQRAHQPLQHTDLEKAVLDRTNAKIQQEMADTMARVGRPLVATDPVAIGLHYRTTNQAQHPAYDKDQQNNYSTHGDPSVNPVTVWSQPPKKVGHPNSQADGKVPKGPAARSDYVPPAGVNVRPVLGPPSISEAQARAAALPDSSKPHFAPHVGFGARSTYGASYVPKKPVVEPEPDQTEVERTRNGINGTLKQSAIDAFATTSKQLGQPEPEPEPEVFAVDHVLEKMRAKIKSRGAVGINRLGRHFKILDDSGDGNLNIAELKKALNEYGFGLDDNEFAEVAAVLDRDGSGAVDYNEFLRAVRGPMNHSREKLVELAFDKLDADRNGYLDLNDIREFYNAKGHPKVQSGEKTEDQVLAEYLDKFDTISKDGKVMREEFLEYYQNISISIDNDDYFELMMRNSWKLNPKILNRLNFHA